eukprot:TRINITY_DN2110_c5_g1_i1.p1 TRINITY_DN2110_c5_g1~~TRINITY_DN2110_c5_g1_i1.p1  ORF type:complete len:198 (+),score=32.64 TRINITY_DN2110_c5_g1_i1:113-706(+)
MQCRILLSTSRINMQRVAAQKRFCCDMLAFDEEDEFNWTEKSLREVMVKCKGRREGITEYTWTFPKLEIPAPSDWLHIEKILQDSANVVFHTNSSKAQLFYEAIPMTGDFRRGFSPVKEFMESINDGSPFITSQFTDNCYIISHGGRMAVASAHYFKDNSAVVAVLFSFPKNTPADDPAVSLGSTCIVNFATAASAA